MRPGTVKVVMEGVAAERRLGVLPIAAGDWLAVCIDEPGDVWSLYRVLEVDDAGVATMVGTRDGHAAAVRDISRAGVVIGTRAAAFDDAGIQALCGVPFLGLKPLKDAMRPWLRVAKS